MCTLLQQSLSEVVDACYFDVVHSSCLHKEVDKETYASSYITHIQIQILRSVYENKPIPKKNHICRSVTEGSSTNNRAAGSLVLVIQFLEDLFSMNIFSACVRRQK